MAERQLRRYRCEPCNVAWVGFSDDGGVVCPNWGAGTALHPVKDAGVYP